MEGSAKMRMAALFLYALGFLPDWYMEIVSDQEKELELNARYVGGHLPITVRTAYLATMRSGILHEIMRPTDMATVSLIMGDILSKIGLRVRESQQQPLPSVRDCK